MARLWPVSATPDARRLVVTRALRGFADGLVSVLLARYLGSLGFSALATGAILTGTLLGSAALTLVVGLRGEGWPRRRLLLGACALMAATGCGFAAFTSFAALFIVAIIGTLNPSAGDVSVFLPTEQAVLAGAVAASDRTALFARYNLAGNAAGALGALASGLVPMVSHQTGITEVRVERAAFFIYAFVAVAAAGVYQSLSPAVDAVTRPRGLPPLVRSRAVVTKLAALFSLDALGGGFAVQALLVLWLYQRFGLSMTTAAWVFFAAGLASGLSQLVSSRLAARFGLINTMVFTHLPANVFLIVAAFMPSAPWAIAFLLLRMALSQMDVPARQSYVMAVVPPDERPAAASVTNVPRSLASALTPLLAGAMLARTSFGWPLVCCGLCKAIYDVLLWRAFKAVPPTT